jgi:hypothetical protein
MDSFRSILRPWGKLCRTPHTRVCKVVCGCSWGLEHRHLRIHKQEECYEYHDAPVDIVIVINMADQAENTKVEEREDDVPAKMKALQ